MGRQPRAERVVEELQGFPPEIEGPEIVLGKADEPYSVVDFLARRPNSD